MTEKQFFDSGAPGSFRTAIRDILSNQAMQELAARDSGLAEQLAREIKGFVNSTTGRLAAAENPFEREEAVFQAFSVVTKDGFAEAWADAEAFIKDTYEAAILDPEFYATEFLSGEMNFESVKEHFLEAWHRLLFGRKTQWELKFIDEQRRLFCEILYKQIQQMKELEEIFEPLTDELGRLWDLSKGSWQKVSLDVLRKYADLFKKDSSLQALADMLGRTQQAEKVYEEEVFLETQISPSWKLEQAQKADLVGIYESGDLSSLLPSEIALFAEWQTEAIFYKKFAEKRLQTFEYQSSSEVQREEQTEKKRQKEKDEAKGPFIICVDTSGSMQGTPETVAKTLCFAVLKMAVREGRECFLISFSDGIKTLRLTDMQGSITKLIDFFSMSFYGGTDPGPAMEEALAMLETMEYKKADIVMVSDFVMPPLDDTTKERVTAARKNKTKFHCLVIGGSGNKNAIDDFDNNWVYDADDPDNALKISGALDKTL